MGNKKFSELTKYEQNLRKFHRLSNRHVLVVETDMSFSDIQKIIKFSDNERKAKNELVAIMNKNYKQLIRTKRYRKLLKLYGSIEDKKKKAVYAKQLNEMQKQYNITWEFCRKSMQPICKKYNIDAVFCITCAEDVWFGMKKILYSDGKYLHFSKYGDFPCIRSKERVRGIPIKVNDNVLQFSFRKMKFGIIIKDRFQMDEVDAIIEYLSNPEIIDNYAVNALLEDGICIDTYRSCYASLVIQKIRGKYRVFAHITIEGKAKPKYDKKGNLRHKYGKGVVGADIGTQTVAYTSDTEVGLKNLAERGQSIKKSERQERLIYRAMDRSRRATNPDNYNDDGTIKKGKKVWKYSKRYKRLKNKHQELCRKNAINRQLAINEDANHLRSLGDVFVTEPKNAKKLMRKVKETTKNDKGKFKRKKRFGKSIKNRCPGGFQSTIEKKFTVSNGVYVEVPNNYRASQYDHTIDDYIKKKLSERMFKLKGSGQKVQRDWYSSFLLYCYNYKTGNIDKVKANKEFEKLYKKEQEYIDWIIENKFTVLNSGIKSVA